MNYILLIFSLMSTAIIIYGSLINLLENRLPRFIVKTFRYGKFAYKGEIPNITSKFVLEVPKSWFKHFYQVSILIYAYTIYLVTSTYIFQWDAPNSVNYILNLLCGDNRVAYTSATKTYIAVMLMALQVFRRFYDTNFVSIFGKNGRINFSAYLIGLYHYPACALAILCEAPKFASESQAASTFDITSITYGDIFCIILFMWAWWHQHVTSKILANLRKNKKGIVVSDAHKLPYGDWFNYLSAPHQTAEVIMYFALHIILWNNITFFFVFTWVLSNQVETILLSHWWYQETFENFPKNRKALIPFCY